MSLHTIIQAFLMHTMLSLQFQPHLWYGLLCRLRGDLQKLLLVNRAWVGTQRAYFFSGSSLSVDIQESGRECGWTTGPQDIVFMTAQAHISLFRFGSCYMTCHCFLKQCCCWSRCAWGHLINRDYCKNRVVLLVTLKFYRAETFILITDWHRLILFCFLHYTISLDVTA